MFSFRETMRRILQLEDEPRRIARGAVIGFFIAMTPPVVPQMAVAFFLAWVLGANRMAALLMTLVTNPVTFLPLQGLNYYIGAWFLGAFAGWQAPPWSEVYQRLAESDGWCSLMLNTARIGGWVLAAMGVGGFMVSLTLSPAVYYAVLRWVNARRHRREGR